MDAIVKRPILAIGLGLSGALWLMDSVGNTVSDVGSVGVCGLAALGAGAWWLGRRSPEPSPEAIPETFDRTTLDRALDRVRGILTQLAEESDDADPQRLALERRLAELDAPTLDRPLNIALAGRKAVGKTALRQALSPSLPDEIALRELPPCFDLDRADPLADARSADLVLFLIGGDPTEPERNAVGQLRQTGQPVWVLWNQSDRCLTSDRPLVLARIRQRFVPEVPRDRVFAVAAAPVPVEVRQYEGDRLVRTATPADPELADLLPRLNAQLGDRAPLIYASAYRRALDLRQEAHGYLNQIRRDRALPLVRRYQWIAAAAAFANPVPSLDLLATGATTTQLVLDLSQLYKQRFSLEQAKAAASALGGVTVNLGLVELSTQLVTAAMKHNPVTFVAGGAAQGLSAAYLTHVAGLSLIEYFESCEPEADSQTVPSGERLAAIVKGVFEANRRSAFVESLVRQASDRFATKPAA